MPDASDLADGHASPEETEALLRAIASYRTYLVAVARGRLGGAMAGREGESDLVQRTLAAAVESVRRGLGPRGDADALRAWLRQVLIHQHGKLVRWHLTAARSPKREEGEPAEIRADTTSPSGRASRAEEARRLASALERLDGRERQILRWREEERATFEEIGRRLEMTSSGARQAYRRALDRLRQLYEGSRSPGPA